VSELSLDWSSRSIYYHTVPFGIDVSQASPQVVDRDYPRVWIASADTRILLPDNEKDPPLMQRIFSVAPMGFEPTLPP